MLFACCTQDCAAASFGAMKPGGHLPPLRFFSDEKLWRRAVERNELSYTEMSMSGATARRAMVEHDDKLSSLRRSRFSTPDFLRLRFAPGGATDFFLGKVDRGGGGGAPDAPASLGSHQQFRMDRNFSASSSSSSSGGGDGGGVLSIGNARGTIDDDDDFNITLAANRRDFIQPYALGIRLVVSGGEKERETFKATAYDGGGVALGVHEFSAVDADGNGEFDANMFVGVLSALPLHRLEVDEPKGGADLAIDTLLFGTAEVDVLWPHLLVWLVLPFAVLAGGLVERNVEARARKRALQVLENAQGSGGGGVSDEFRTRVLASAARSELVVGVVSWVAWLLLTALFALWIYVAIAAEASLLFVTSFLLEEFLSADNLFIFYLVFKGFALRHEHVQSVLLMGIVASMFLRVFILSIGVELMHTVSWLFPLCGLLLIATGAKMFAEEATCCKRDGGDDDDDDDDDDDGGGGDDDVELNVFGADGGGGEAAVAAEERRKRAAASEAGVGDDSCFMRTVKQCLPLTDAVDDAGSLFLRSNSDATAATESGAGLAVCLRGYRATPVFLALLAVIFSNIVFSLDSIPAVLSVTTNAPLLLSAEAFSLMSMRSLYTCISSASEVFVYVQSALAFILVFIGCKLLAGSLLDYEIESSVVLLVVISSLGVAVAASMYAGRGAADKGEADAIDDGAGDSLLRGSAVTRVASGSALQGRAISS
jgi:tellurite resistance protein TerC